MFSAHSSIAVCHIDWSQILPAAISVPFLEVSAHLGLPPTATYAALNLWNFTSSSPNDLSCLENLSVLHTFTGTIDEEWFYSISVAIEARGADIIPIMLKAMDAVRADEAGTVSECLLEFADAIQEIGFILERMHEKCAPEVFYHQIRPFLAGSKNAIVEGLPRGVFYDEGDGNGFWRQYNGGSNAQSSLIQYFDVVLGIKHQPTKGNAETGQKSFLKVCFVPVLIELCLMEYRQCETTCLAAIAVSWSMSSLCLIFAIMP